MANNTEETKLPQYSYRRLAHADSLRILCVKPSQDVAAALDCELIHESRSEIMTDFGLDRNYEAVSYTWGYTWSPSHFSEKLFCDGMTAFLSITPVVDMMLRHLRKKYRTRRLWIDAVCLNQNDNQEKEVQVQCMDQIYHEAKKVHVWLGSKPENAATQMFAFIRASIIVSEQNQNKPLAVHDPSVLSGSIPSKEIQAVLQLPWFRRRWVLQEVANGHDITIHCGHAKMPWLSFQAGLNLLHENGILNRINLSKMALDALAVVTAISEKKNSILDLVWNHHATECSDLRDRLFALIGMANDLNFAQSNLVQFTSTYQDDWLTVYCRFASFCIQKGDSALIERHRLAFGSLYSSDKRLPSWVPDWRRRRRLPSALDSHPHSSVNLDTARWFRPLHGIETPIYSVGKVGEICGGGLFLTLEQMRAELFDFLRRLTFKTELRRKYDAVFEVLMKGLGGGFVDVDKGIDEYIRTGQNSESDTKERLSNAVARFFPASSILFVDPPSKDPQSLRMLLHRDPRSAKRMAAQLPNHHTQSPLPAASTEQEKRLLSGVVNLFGKHCVFQSKVDSINKLHKKENHLVDALGLGPLGLRADDIIASIWVLSYPPSQAFGGNVVWALRKVPSESIPASTRSVNAWCTNPDRLYRILGPCVLSDRTVPNFTAKDTVTLI